MARLAESFDVDRRQPDDGSTDDGVPSRSTWKSWLVLALPVVILTVGAWNYRWVQEDAFINFRIIANLLAGHGPVYNVGERVEVYSDPLWLFLVAGLHEVTPFLSIEWLTVLLGIGFTVTGVILGGRAIQRLGESRGEDLVIPVGLLIFSVVAGVWEFTTSGLEMGMVFGWIGLSFWLLVRTEQHRNSALWCAFVVGLGTLIRPELVLMSGVFLVALGLVVAAPGWKGPTALWRRYGLPLLVALALPVLYEIWRMAYFAMVVANPALAKSGGSAWWSQGFIYLRNFVMPYGLWIPFLLVLPFAVPRLSKWWTAGDRIGLVVLLTPLLAGMVDVLYVVHLGGDYMHARLLLPAFLSICVGLYVDIRQCRSLLAVFFVGIAMWAVVSASQLRWSVPDVVVFGFRGIGTYHGITNERSYSTLVSGKSHPITLADYGNRPLDDEYRAAAELAQRQGRHLMLVVNNPFKPFAVADIRNARPILPSRFAVNATTIGVNGVESGPQVYIYDSLSLANPIGSHTKLSVHGRPGHEKAIGTAWMIARFAPAGEQFPAGSPSTTSVNAARRALSCNPLHSYLNAITAPLSFSLMWSNIVHSIGYTTMSYSPTPDIAARQLCG